LRRSRQTSGEEGPKVPAYIVTYSDMVTLLLTFFVMLLTLADVQDPELFDKGRDSFLESIRYVGLGTLFGREKKPDFGSIKSKYHIENPDESADIRTIDAKKEELRRVLENLKKSTKTVPSQLVAKKNNFTVTNIHFSPGQANLNDSAKKYLTGFCSDLQHSASSEPITLYVLGLAPEEKSDRQQWIISAMRAEITAKYIRTAISSISEAQNQSRGISTSPEWSVFSWGAGAGGDWAGPDSPISDSSHILIAILRQSI